MELITLDLGTRLCDYEQTWELQRQVHAEVLAGERPDTVLLLEHAPVYTAGRRTNRADRPVDGTPVVDVDRGGKITWHGPGQLVAYPIVRLREPVDVVAYVRALEEAVLGLCADLGIAGERVEGRSGVWLPGPPDAKLAAIGCRVAKGVTMHGVALNASCDTGAFTRIVPCGLPGTVATSLTSLLGRRVGPTDVVDAFAAHLRTSLTPHLAASTGASPAAVRA